MRPWRFSAPTDRVARGGRRPGSALARGGVVGLVVLLAAFACPQTTLRLVREGRLRIAGVQHGTIDVDGRTLAWCRVGARGARPLVLQHGLRGEAGVLLPLARALERRGYEVLLLDLPGHGSSPDSSSDLTIDEAGRLIVAAAQRLGFGDHPAYVGHSLGGWILAWQALARPEAFGSLTLIAAPGLRAPLPPLRLLSTQSVDDARAALPALFSTPPPVPSFLLWFAVRRRSATALSLLRSVVSGDYLLDDLLPALTVPAQVIVGADDRLVPPAIGRALADRLPAHRFSTIPQAGHLVVWERPEETAELIDRFDRAVDRPAVPN